MQSIHKGNPIYSSARQSEPASGSEPNFVLKEIEFLLDKYPFVIKDNTSNKFIGVYNLPQYVGEGFENMTSTSQNYWTKGFDNDGKEQIIKKSYYTYTPISEICLIV